MIYYHERLQRGETVLAGIREIPATVCGAGALGANILESLARAGFCRLRVIDRDRVEERNLSTQPYYRSDVGALKARLAANALYRALGVTVDARADELTPANAARLLAGSALVVDTFDNGRSRQAVQDACRASGMPCLHAGLAAGYGEVMWDAGYRVPSAAQDDVCDYPLARNLAMLTATVACEAAIRFAAAGETRSYTITLEDLAIREIAP
jgi:molybdopterin-synthase adenylyltransferase